MSTRLIFTSPDAILPGWFSSSHNRCRLQMPLQTHLMSYNPSGFLQRACEIMDTDDRADETGQDQSIHAACNRAGD